MRLFVELVRAPLLIACLRGEPELEAKAEGGRTAGKPELRLLHEATSRLLRRATSAIRQ